MQTRNTTTRSSRTWTPWKPTPRWVLTQCPMGRASWGVQGKGSWGSVLASTKGGLKWGKRQ